VYTHAAQFRLAANPNSFGFLPFLFPSASLARAMAMLPWCASWIRSARIQAECGEDVLNHLCPSDRSDHEPIRPMPAFDPAPFPSFVCNSLGRPGQTGQPVPVRHDKARVPLTDSSQCLSQTRPLPFVPVHPLIGVDRSSRHRDQECCPLCGRRSCLSGEQRA